MSSCYVDRNATREDTANGIYFTDEGMCSEELILLNSRDEYPAERFVYIKRNILTFAHVGILYSPSAKVFNYSLR